MNRIGFALSILLIVGIAAWAYHVNYRTKTALGRIDTLRAEIAAEREALQVAQVEWAYLNAPMRLTHLAQQHQQVLGLVPLDPSRFDQVAAMPFPPADPADLAATVVATQTLDPVPPPPATHAPATPAPAAPPVQIARADPKPGPKPGRAQPPAASQAKPTPPRPAAAAPAKPARPTRVEVAPARIAAAPLPPAPVETESTGGQVETLSDSDLLDVLGEVADTIARSAAQPSQTEWIAGGRAND